MNSPYFQPGAPQMQMPDYQAFLQLLQQIRKQNAGPTDSSQGLNMDGFAQFAKKFFPGASVSSADMARAAAPGYYDMPAPTLNAGDLFA